MLAATSLRCAARQLSRRSPSVAVVGANAPQQLQRRGYHENIVEHYENPQNVGSLDKNDESVGTLQIKVNDDGTIQESKFKTFGCGSAIASSSVATEWVKGKHVDEVLAIKNTDIAAHLKLPPVKLHCSMLAEDAIRAAVNDWKAKKEAKMEAA
ncbi:hypothetical protein ACHAXT_011061 [Thalassiosira profunda]